MSFSVTAYGADWREGGSEGVVNGEEGVAIIQVTKDGDKAKSQW